MNQIFVDSLYLDINWPNFPCFPPLSSISLRPTRIQFYNKKVKHQSRHEHTPSTKYVYSMQTHLYAAFVLAEYAMLCWLVVCCFCLFMFLRSIIEDIWVFEGRIWKNFQFGCTYHKIFGSQTRVSSVKIRDFIFFSKVINYGTSVMAVMFIKGKLEII